MSGLRAQPALDGPFAVIGCTMPSAFRSNPESFVDAGFESCAVRLLVARVSSAPMDLVERRSIQTSA